MALTRKNLWAITLVALAIVGVRMVVLAPRYKKSPAPTPPAPEAQLGLGTGCNASELPGSLSVPPPRGSSNRETVEMKMARQKITFCVLQRMWPTAKIVFRWDDKGEGRYDVVFPDNAYRHASVVSMSLLSATRTNITFAAFVWLPYGDEYAMPPLVVARADGDGNVSEYHAFAVDTEARIVDKSPPEWNVSEEHLFWFSYEANYAGDSKPKIEWFGGVDTDSAAVVSRLPTRVHLANGAGARETWTLKTDQTGDDSLLMNAKTSGASKEIRVGCETMSGSNCVVRTADLLSALSR